jgi:hypothetical protein
MERLVDLGEQMSTQCSEYVWISPYDLYCPARVMGSMMLRRARERRRIVGLVCNCDRETNYS